MPSAHLRLRQRQQNHFPMSRLIISFAFITSQHVGCFVPSTSNHHPRIAFVPHHEVTFAPISSQRINNIQTHAYRNDENSSYGRSPNASDSLSTSNNNKEKPPVPTQHGLLHDMTTHRSTHKVASNGAHITMIGSGPGSPDLLTVAANRILTEPTEKNQLIIADRLVSKEILDVCVGEVRTANKHPGCQEKAQNEIYEWVEEGVRDGRHVIRLKIGDPFVFGRGGEEVLNFRKMGMEPTVIPGVSAAFSAPLLGGIPVTHRGTSNQVVMCTGYGRNNTSPDLIQYHKEQTVVFLMAVGRLKTLCENLVNMAKYPIETPVAIVERAGCPNQRTLIGNMENIADLAVEYNIQAPSTIVVGDVVHVLLEDDENKDELVQGLISNALNVTTLV